jgi:hypothetical protein
MRSGPDATLSTAEIGKTFLVVNTQNDKPTPSAVEERTKGGIGTAAHDAKLKRIDQFLQ